MKSRTSELELRDLGYDAWPTRPDLKQRATCNVPAETRLRYVVLRGKEEVAFLSFDLIPTWDFLVLYEMYVAKPFRRQGIGTQILDLADDIARRHGRKSVVHTVGAPLDSDISHKKLVQYFLDRGFQRTRRARNSLERFV